MAAVCKDKKDIAHTLRALNGRRDASASLSETGIVAGFATLVPTKQGLRFIIDATRKSSEMNRTKT